MVYINLDSCDTSGVGRVLLCSGLWNKIELVGGMPAFISVHSR